MRSVYKQIGCRPPWDTLSSMEICDTTEEITEYFEKLNKNFVNEQKVIVESTGCLIPCRFREYKTEWEPFEIENYYADGDE